MPEQLHQVEAVKLSDILVGIVAVDAQSDRQIVGLTLDSRHVKEGDCFVACAGGQVDGRDYISQAVANGAVAVICEAKNNEKLEAIIANEEVPVIEVENLQQHVSAIAAQFFQKPSQQMTIIGITGTNGKTSCSQFLAMALEEFGQRCGVIGTIGSGFINAIESESLTTPDPILLQQRLAEMKKQGAQAVAMEVSSHGLAQHRVEAVAFDIAVFTNLSRDHLDYHSDMEDYANAKKQLFTQPGIRSAVINADDEFGRKLIAEFKSELDIYSYSLEDQAVDVPIIKAEDISFGDDNFVAKVRTPWGEGKLQANLLGRFNVSNVLAVLASLCVMGVPFEKALQSISKIRTVPGRLQAFGGGKQPLVVVDFAHTPDALKEALLVLREHCRGSLWCVFGCGGDRDAGKRPMMAQIAERYSDQLIITDDNPRTENPTQITDDIVKGLLCPWAVEVLHNRHAAIVHAVSCAQEGDVVLVAGKGHETYQIIGTEKIAFNDAEEVQLLLK